MNFAFYLAPRNKRHLRFVAFVAVVLLTSTVAFEPSTTVPSAMAQSVPPSHREASARTIVRQRPDVARFGSRVDAALAASHAALSYWGIMIADRDTGETLYSLNPDHFFTPASNAKIFTTALALATLGPDYRYRTTLESQGTLGADGHLVGDLTLVGRGDPDLSNRRFPYDRQLNTDGAVEKVLAEMADKAVAKGLREVDGDVVADDSYFPYDPYPSGWAAGDQFFRFGAPVSAIAFNDNVLTVRLFPGETIGSPAILTTDPEAVGSSFGREVITVSATETSDLSVTRQPGENFILLRGTIALGHAAMKIDLAMSRPAEVAADELRLLLKARGVRITGQTSAIHGAPPRTSASGDPILPLAVSSAVAGQLGGGASSNPLILAEHFSQPLLEIVRITNKVSQNLHAEILLRTVGQEKLGLGSTAAGLQVERNFLKATGVTEGDVILSDGSGLARDDLVTPRAMCALLAYVSRQPWGAAFLSTLPIAGVDGTLENRMKNTVAAGLIAAKTGAEDHVRALSGYVTTLHGKHLVFAIFANNNPQHGTDATATLDAIGVAAAEILGDDSSLPTTR